MTEAPGAARKPPTAKGGPHEKRNKNDRIRASDRQLDGGGVMKILKPSGRNTIDGAGENDTRTRMHGSRAERRCAFTGQNIEGQGGIDDRHRKTQAKPKGSKGPGK